MIDVITFKSCPSIPHCYWVFMTIMIQKVKEIALMMATLFYTINLMYEFTRLQALGKPTDQALRRSLFDAVKVIFCIVFYEDLLKAFDSKIIYPLCETIYKLELSQIHINTAPTTGSYSLLSLLFTGTVWGLFSLIGQGGIGVVVHFCKGFTIIMLVMMGPLSIAASLLPGSSGIFKFWLKTTLSIFCWSITLAVLDVMMFASLATLQIDIWGYIAIIVMYLKVPSITSMFTNSMGSGNALSGLTTMAGMIGMAARASTTGGASLGVRGVGKLGRATLKTGNAAFKTGRAAFNAGINSIPRTK
jgi:hypothetical protein